MTLKAKVKHKDSNVVEIALKLLGLRMLCDKIYHLWINFSLTKDFEHALLLDHGLLPTVVKLWTLGLMLFIQLLFGSIYWDYLHYYHKQLLCYTGEAVGQVKILIIKLKMVFCDQFTHLTVTINLLDHLGFFIILNINVKRWSMNLFLLWQSGSFRNNIMHLDSSPCNPEGKLMRLAIPQMILPIKKKKNVKVNYKQNIQRWK